VEDREVEEHVFANLLLESLVCLVPLATFKEETVDEDTFGWWVESLAFNAAVIATNDVLKDFCLVVDLIERPALTLLLSSDLLLHGSEETLRVEEASQPEALGSLLEEPAVELVVTIEETLEPGGQTGSHPGDFDTSGIVLPLARHTEIADGVDGVNDLGCHDNLTVNGLDHIGHSAADNTENQLEALELLEQEGIERHSATSVTETLGATESLDAFVNLDLVEIGRQQFDQFVLELLLHFFLAGLATR